MEIRISTNQLLKIAYILAWILFIGVCIEAGGFLFNAFYTLFINPEAAVSFWQKIDFSALYRYDPGYFLAQTLLMSIVATLKAVLLYLVVKMLRDKKLNMDRPFSRELGRFMFALSYMALLIGFFSCWGVGYAEWLVSHGITMPEISLMRLDGADVWLFMGATLFVVAHIFKKGIEIQTENELTV